MPVNMAGIPAGRRLDCRRSRAAAWVSGLASCLRCLPAASGLASCRQHHRKTQDPTPDPTPPLTIDRAVTGAVANGPGLKFVAWSLFAMITDANVGLFATMLN
jgi:hypothetical protein